MTALAANPSADGRNGRTDDGAGAQEHSADDLRIADSCERGAMNTDDLQTVWAPRMLSILRIVAALIFMEHGTQKLFNFPPSDGPRTELLSLLGLAGVLELVGGLLLVLGLCTRPVAFILAGMMAVAYWMAHAPQSFFPALNGGDAAILYCFVFLYLTFAGGGPWSLDAVRRRG
jgi:putative oxidoreductase